MHNWSSESRLFCTLGFCSQTHQKVVHIECSQCVLVSCIPTCQPSPPPPRKIKSIALYNNHD